VGFLLNMIWPIVIPPLCLLVTVDVFRLFKNLGPDAGAAEGEVETKPAAGGAGGAAAGAM
jgi:hypothetical protein